MMEKKFSYLYDIHFETKNQLKQQKEYLQQQGFLTAIFLEGIQNSQDQILTLLKKKIKEASLKRGDDDEK